MKITLDLPDGMICAFFCGVEHTGKGDIPTTVGYIAKNEGKVIGEFVCDRIDTLLPANEPYGIYDIDDDYVFQTCLEYGALWDYGNGQTLYGWHISNLKIYNESKALNEFTAACRYKNDDGTCPSRRIACSFQRYDYNPDGSINIVECGNTIRRPPQSWGYVEEL